VSPLFHFSTFALFHCLSCPPVHSPTRPLIHWRASLAPTFPPLHLCTFPLPLVFSSPTCPLVHSPTRNHLFTFAPLHLHTASCLSLSLPFHSPTSPLVITFPPLHFCTFALHLASPSPTSPLVHSPTSPPILPTFLLATALLQCSITA
jgi:hypothetical protein